MNTMTVTEDQVRAIQNAYEATKGTSDYTRYLMCLEYKHKNGWKFLGWGAPYPLNGGKYYIKKTSAGEYLYIENPSHELVRYGLTEASKEVMFA